MVGDTSEGSTHAAHKAISTDPLSRREASDTGRDPIVHESVAVVVFVVADLSGRKDTACTGCPLGILAKLCSVFAITLTTVCGWAIEARLRKRGCGGGLVVDLSVAIVIETIADLDGRGDFTLAGLPTAKFTFLCACFADPKALEHAVAIGFTAEAPRKTRTCE